MIDMTTKIESKSRLKLSNLVDIVFSLCISNLLCNGIQIGDISLMVLSMMIFKNFSTQDGFKVIIPIFQFWELSRDGSEKPLSLLATWLYKKIALLFYFYGG